MSKTLTPAMTGTSPVRELLGKFKGSANWAALSVFAVRAGSSALMFLSQVILARWMGPDEYGHYVAAWTVVLVLGAVSTLGLNIATMRLVPHYAAREEYGLLRGMVHTSRVLVLLASSTLALIAAVVMAAAFGSELSFSNPILIGLFCLPAFAYTDMQDCLGRGRGWNLEAMVPPYILRPTLLLLILAGLQMLGFTASALLAIASAAVATLIAAVVQTACLERRMTETVPACARETDLKGWLTIALPMLGVSVCEVIMQNADVLVLNLFRSHSEIGVYYAAGKTTALALFVQYSIGSVYAGRLAAAGAMKDQDQIRELSGAAVRATFFPSAAFTLGIVAIGYPVLYAFGERFTEAYPLMFILAIGVLARSSIGPSETVLNMLGQQRACAIGYAIAATVCIAMNFAIVPTFGIYGAAVATASALVTNAVIGWHNARRFIGVNLFILANLRKSSATSASSA